MPYKAANGVPFTMRLVDTGDSYGLNDCLTNDNPPMIEFYDARYTREPYGPRGQFVQRYYVETLATIKPGAGLNLDNGVADWTIDGATLDTMLRDALLFI